MAADIKKVINFVITHPKIAALLATVKTYAGKTAAAAKNWYQNTSKKVTIPVIAVCLLVVSMFGWGFILKPIVNGVSGILSVFKSEEEVIVPEAVEEKIEIKVAKLITNATLDPVTIDVKAGEYIELHHDESSCFYVNGNYKSGSYLPSSNFIHLAFRAQDGKEYRLGDYITSYRSPFDGQLKLFVRITEEENQVWTGTSENCTAERISDFQKGSIYLTIKRIEEGEMESDNAEVAKLIEGEKTIKGKDALIAQLKQDEEVKKAIVIMREKGANIFNHIFDRPITIKGQ